MSGNGSFVQFQENIRRSTYSKSSGKGYVRITGKMGILNDVVSVMNGKIHETLWATMLSCAIYTSEHIAYAINPYSTDTESGFMQSNQSGTGFKSITGNLLESFGLAIVGTNPEKSHLSVLGFAPFTKHLGWKTTMPALKSGESYTGKRRVKRKVFDGSFMTKYADGSPVDPDSPYVGESGNVGSRSGKTERMKYIETLRSYGNSFDGKMYTLHAFFAMPYASKVNIKHHNKAGKSVSSFNFFNRIFIPELIVGFKRGITEVRNLRKN